MRPAKVTALKVLAGTIRPDRVRALPRFSADVPKAPASLSPAARKLWRELAQALAERRVLTAGDRRILGLCCQALAQHSEAMAVLAAEGPTYTTLTATGSTLYRPRPEVSIASDAWRRAAMALAQLGLTPRSRGTVEAVR